jgi:hypothetical protein
VLRGGTTTAAERVAYGERGPATGARDHDFLSSLPRVAASPGLMLSSARRALDAIRRMEGRQFISAPFRALPDPLAKPLPVAFPKVHRIGQRAACFCGTCGTPLRSQENFCAQCGTRRG